MYFKLWRSRADRLWHLSVRDANAKRLDMLERFATREEAFAAIDQLREENGPMDGNHMTTGGWMTLSLDPAQPVVASSAYTAAMLEIRDIIDFLAVGFDLQLRESTWNWGSHASEGQTSVKFKVATDDIERTIELPLEDVLRMGHKPTWMRIKQRLMTEMSALATEASFDSEHPAVGNSKAS